MMVEDAQRQALLEARLEQTWARGIDPHATVAASFGPLESWALQVGPHRLLLDPLLKEWLYYDRLHDSWQPTGVQPGEGVFCAQGKRLGVKRPAGAAPAQGIHPAKPGSKFCSGCGAPVRPNQRFCNSCGKALTEESPLGHRP